MNIFTIDYKVNEVRCADYNKSGRNWRVKLLFKGDKYGLENCLTHDKDEPMIEFYDLTYVDKFGTDGQFVSRYKLSTILFEGWIFSRSELMNASEKNPRHGIALQGDVPEWEISADCLNEIVKQIKILYIKNQLAPLYPAPAREEVLF